jgi:hypothetical protein
MSGLIKEKNTFLMILVNIVQNMESSMRPQRPTHPNQMGLLNGKNRTLRDLVNAMLDCFGLSKSCWGEAILTAGIVLNRVSSSKGEITPYEAWKGRKPALGFLRACGCLAKVNAPACKK